MDLTARLIVEHLAQLLLPLLLGRTAQDGLDHTVTRTAWVEFIQRFGPWEGMLNRISAFVYWSRGSSDSGSMPGEQPVTVPYIAPWYYGDCNRAGAEAALERAPVGHFLVRVGRYRSRFALSMVNVQGVSGAPSQLGGASLAPSILHVNLVNVPRRGYVLGNDTPSGSWCLFANVTDVLEANSRLLSSCPLSPLASGSAQAAIAAVVHHGASSRAMPVPGSAADSGDMYSNVPSSTAGYAEAGDTLLRATPHRIVASAPASSAVAWTMDAAMAQIPVPLAATADVNSFQPLTSWESSSAHAVSARSLFASLGVSTAPPSGAVSMAMHAPGHGMAAAMPDMSGYDSFVSPAPPQMGTVTRADSGSGYVMPSYTAKQPGMGMPGMPAYMAGSAGMPAFSQSALAGGYMTGPVPVSSMAAGLPASMPVLAGVSRGLVAAAPAAKMGLSLQQRVSDTADPDPFNGQQNAQQYM